MSDQRTTMQILVPLDEVLWAVGLVENRYHYNKDEKAGDWEDVMPTMFALWRAHAARAEHIMRESLDKPPE